jgi:dinuclear metal center YbgI/SA1388 family protein
VASRDEIAGFCDEMLRIETIPDGLPNGLQVPGAAEVRLLVTGVTASLELFRRAAAEGAQMVLVHHGMFYGAPRGPIDAREKTRLKTLFDADLSLLAYHLPLDAHPEVGNSAIVGRLLGLTEVRSFQQFGVIGELERPVPFDELLERVEREIRQQPLVLRHGPDTVGRLAVVTGSAAGELSAAADAGADAFVTGEPREQAASDAREAGIHFIAAGHHATETFGVRAMGDIVAERFGVEHRYIEVPNPI